MARLSSTVPKSAGKRVTLAEKERKKKSATVREGIRRNKDKTEEDDAEGGKKAVTIKKSKSVLSRSFAVNLRRHLSSSSKRGNNNSSNSSSNVKEKGCLCRIGSGFKALIYLSLMLLTTGAVGAWLYHNRFGLRARYGPDDHPVSGSTGSVDQIPAVVEEDLYLDFQGNIHKISEIRVDRGIKKVESGGEVLEVAGPTVPTGGVFVGTVATGGGGFGGPWQLPKGWKRKKGRKRKKKGGEKRKYENIQQCLDLYTH